jgi:hypothetical protein
MNAKITPPASRNGATEQEFAFFLFRFTFLFTR